MKRPVLEPTARALTFDWFQRHPAGHPQAGQHITRERTCACGRRYIQLLLSDRWLAVVEQAGAGAEAALFRDVPTGYVPVLCPACERRALAHYPVPRTSALASR